MTKDFVYVVFIGGTSIQVKTLRLRGYDDEGSMQRLGDLANGSVWPASSTRASQSENLTWKPRTLVVEVADAKRSFEMVGGVG